MLRCYQIFCDFLEARLHDQLFCGFLKARLQITLNSLGFLLYLKKQHKYMEK
jgi:hypothetical protein